MAEEEGKQEEEKLEFTAEGEALGYISLDQARVLALQHARDNREFYGRYADQELLWQFVGADETEDYYEVKLSYRPARAFRGRPGIEQFTIDKTGPIEFRQILSQPVNRRLTWVTAAVVSAIVVATVAILGGLLASGVLTGEESPVAITVFGAWVPVEPDAVATLESPNGDIVVTVPEASVDHPVGLRFSSVSVDQIPPLPQGYVASSYFDLSVVPDPDGEPISFGFLKLITIEIALSTADIALAGEVESNVVVQHFKDDEWISLPTTVDFGGSTAQVEVESLSLFALTIFETPVNPVPVLTPTATPTPTPIPTEAPIATPTPLPAPTATPAPAPTPVSAATTSAPATAVPVPTAVPAPTIIPTPVVERLLETAISPEAWGSVQAFPRSDNGRYASGTTVAVTARCALGFVTWAGDVPEGLSPYENPLTVSMNRDLVLVAICVQPTATPVPVPTPTPAPTPTPEPRYTLSINGFAIGSGQNSLAVGNGTILLSQSPDADGTYVRNTELTLLADTGGLGAQIFWSGVQSGNGNQATVRMAGTRSIIIPSRQPTPTPTPLPSLEVPGSLPTATPAPTPTPAPTATLAPGVTPTITPTPSPTPAPLTGKIVFAREPDGVDGWDIYVIDADGSNLTRITNTPGHNLDPAWSHDGGEIVFETHRDGNAEIYVMNSDGSDQVRLTNQGANDLHPDWSPDGTKIAFSSERDGNREIYVMGPNGSNQTRLTSNSASDDDPSWSSDGTQIAFASLRDGKRQIYIMDSDGSNQTRVTNNISNDQVPRWSPNGTRISFVSDRDGNLEVYVMEVDGSNQIRLTNENATDNIPTWSPNGQNIAFRSLRDGSPQIYVINSDGTNTTRLTDFAGQDTEPDWGP